MLITTQRQFWFGSLFIFIQLWRIGILRHYVCFSLILCGGPLFKARKFCVLLIMNRTGSMFGCAFCELCDRASAAVGWLFTLIQIEIIIILRGFAMSVAVDSISDVFLSLLELLLELYLELLMLSSGSVSISTLLSEVSLGSESVSVPWICSAVAWPVSGAVSDSSPSWRCRGWASVSSSASS